MSKRLFSDLVKLAEESLRQRQFGEVVRLLERVKLGYEDKTEWASVAKILDQIPSRMRAESAPLIYAKALRFLGRHEQLLEWSKYIHSLQNQSIAVQVDLNCAASLNALGKYEEASTLLRKLLYPRVLVGKLFTG